VNISAIFPVAVSHGVVAAEPKRKEIFLAQVDGRKPKLESEGLMLKAKGDSDGDMGRQAKR
jgi:hypothetical protein